MGFSPKPSSAAAVPDPIIPGDGTQNLTGDLVVSGNIGSGVNILAGADLSSVGSISAGTTLSAGGDIDAIGGDVNATGNMTCDTLDASVSVLAPTVDASVSVLAPLVDTDSVVAFDVEVENQILVGAVLDVSGDAVFNDNMTIPIKSDATRGAAGQAGRVIFNTDDNMLNIDDGGNWTLPDGTAT